MDADDSDVIAARNATLARQTARAARPRPTPAEIRARVEDAAAAVAALRALADGLPAHSPEAATVDRAVGDAIVSIRAVGSALTVAGWQS